MTESREAAVKKTMDEQERLHYDEGDSQRIADATGRLTSDIVLLIETIGNFDNELTRPVDEDTESRMGYARRELVERYAFAQVALAKLGCVFRIDGDEAFKRMLDFYTGPEDAALDMTGL